MRLRHSLLIFAAIGSLLGASGPDAAEPGALDELYDLLDQTGEDLKAITRQADRMAGVGADTPGSAADAGSGPGPGGAEEAQDRVESEPNDSFGKAMTAGKDATITGSISPKGDADWYRVPIEHQGALAITTPQVPENLDLSIRLWDAEKRTASGWLAPLRTGGPTEGVLDLVRPGDWYLEVRDGRNDNASPEPYSMKLDFTPTADTGEPNDSFGTAQPLELGAPHAANILPKGDVDWYLIDAPGHGQLDLLVSEVAQNLDISLRVWSAEKRTLSGWLAPLREGASTEAQFDLPAAGLYWLEVRDGHNDNRSEQPYLLTASLKPSPDAHEPNDSFGTASVIQAGRAVTATILPKGDADWFEVDLPSRGALEILAVPESRDLDIAVRVWSTEKRTLSGWYAPLRAGGETRDSFNVPEPGRYFLEVRDGHNDARSVEPYRLELSFTPAG